MDNPLRPTEIKTPHAGSSNVPEEVRERPLPQYETDSPLDANTKVPTSPTQLVKEELGEQKTVTPVEKKKSKRGLMIGIGGAAAAVAVAAGAVFTVNAMNSNNQSEVPAMPIDPAGVENEEPAPEDPEVIAAMDALDQASFEALPQEEQLMYVDYRIHANTDYYNSLIETKGKENSSVWTEPSRDMSGSEILGNVNYVRDASGLSIDDSGYKLLDKDEAVKMLYGAYYNNPTSDLMSDQFYLDRDYINNNNTTERFVTDDIWEEVSSTELQTGKDLAGNPIEYKDVVFTTENDQKLAGRFVYKEFTSIDGDEKGAWLLEVFVETN